MLRVYLMDLIRDDFLKRDDVILDVEEAFDGLRGTDFERLVINKVEGGEYIDTKTWRTKFGEVLPVSLLSTGSKACIVVQNNPDKIIDCAECMPIARDTIVKRLKEGSVIIHDDQYTVNTYKEDDLYIDAAIDNCRFHTLDAFNDYMYDGAWMRDRSDIKSLDITWEEKDEKFYY